MTFTQHKKFLLGTLEQPFLVCGDKQRTRPCFYQTRVLRGPTIYKKYYSSCYLKRSYRKFSSEIFDGSNFTLRSFQSLIRSIRFFNIFKNKCSKTQNIYFPFKCFLFLNSLKIQNTTNKTPILFNTANLAATVPRRPLVLIQAFSYSYFYNVGPHISLHVRLSRRWVNASYMGVVPRARGAFGVIKALKTTSNAYEPNKKNLFLNRKVYYQKWDYRFIMIIQNFIISINQRNFSMLIKRQRFISNSLKGILLVNFPEKEKNFLIKNLAAENKIPLITQSASLLLKDSRNMDDLLGVDDPIQILFDKVKTCIPCICFINNLDRIGKQRYQQEQQSLYWLNNSISLLTDHRFTGNRVFGAIDQKKESVNLQTTVLSKKAFVLDHNFQKMAILKNLKTFQINTFKNLKTSSGKRVLKYLIWSGQSSNKNKLQQTRPFINLFIRLSIWSKDCSIYTDTNKKPYYTLKKKPFIFSTKPKILVNTYYHRLPFWLSKMSLIFKHKIGTDKTKLFGFFDYSYQNQKKKRFVDPPTNLLALKQKGGRAFEPPSPTGASRVLITSLQLMVNSLPLQMTFSETSPAKTESIFEKFQSKVVYPKTNFKNISYNQVSFKDLGKINKNPETYFLTSTKNRPSAERSGFAYRETTSKAMGGYPTTYKPLFKTEIEPNKNNSLKLTETDIIKRTALLKFLQILDGFHTTSGNQKLLSFPYFNSELFKKFNMSKIFLTWSKKIESKPSKLKMNNKSSLSIKNLLAPLVLQEKSRNYANVLTINSIQNNIWFPYGILLGWTQTPKKNLFKFIIKDFFIINKNHKNSQGSRFLFKSPTAKNNSVQKQNSNLLRNFDDQANLKNYFTVSHQINQHSLFVRSRELFRGPIDTNLERGRVMTRPVNNLTGRIITGRKYDNLKHGCLRRWSPKITTFKKVRENKKHDMYGQVMLYKPKNNFLGHALTCGSFSLPNKVPKWEMYLKNQPSLKSLNLLCVWPSYIEDFVGPFNVNDGASYILPEYFQLLGHGPKLKKQGITLIASTNNLTTLDAALLRPGRFDTIINFSDSFSLSTHKSFKIFKHSPCLIKDKYFSLSQSSIINKEIVHFSVGLSNISLSKSCRWPLKHSSFKVSKRQPRSLFFLTNKGCLLKDPLLKTQTSGLFGDTNKRCFDRKFRPRDKLKNSLFFFEKNYGFLFNNAILLPSISSINIYKAIKNQFYPQITVLDIPSQSVPIKTFIDVSAFIQYKLWWSFSNEKLSWLHLYQKVLLQEPKIGVFNSEKFKIFEPSTYGVILILRSNVYKIKDLIYIFIGALRTIYLRLFYNFLQFSIMFKTKLINKNKTKFMSKTHTVDPPTNIFALNDLKQERDRVFDSSPAHAGASKDPKTEAWELPNYKNKIIKNFISNFHMEHDKIFLKFNRSLLFCTGDFDYEVYSKKDSDIILAKTKLWKRKQDSFWPLLSNSASRFRGLQAALGLSFRLKDKMGEAIGWNPSYKNQTKNVMQSHSAISIKNKKKALDYSLSTETKKNTSKIKLELDCSTQFVDVSTFFLDQSFKIWKPLQVKFFKNVNIDNALLNKYNKIYKLKKIKFKQQSFFNLHPFSEFMLKRWSELVGLRSKTDSAHTKSNKLKRHLKISLVFEPHIKQHSCFDSLPVLDTLKQERLVCLYTQTNQASKHERVLRRFDTPKREGLMWEPYKNILGFPNIQTYNNLSSATLLIPTHMSFLEKKSSKTLAIDSFFSTYKSYLLKKISTNFSLNITCLQIDPTLINLEKKINSEFFKESMVCLDPQTKNTAVFESVPNTDAKNANNYKSSPYKNPISSVHLSQKESRLKTIPRRNVTNHTHSNFQTTCKIKYYHLNTDELKLSHNVILFKNSNLVSNEKKEHNSVKIPKSFFQNYKMCRLDISFFVLIFYIMFFEKMQHKKITLNTMKIFMPYKSLIFSHFLLSQKETYDFSCKNFEILIYNKFKNFLVDF